MLIRPVTPPPPVAKPAESKAAQAPQARRSLPLGLIIALNVVLVLALALVLYFVFRPAPPAATQETPAPTLPPGAAVKAPAVPTPAVPKPTVPTIPKP
jgi:hypothetical protein